MPAPASISRRSNLDRPILATLAAHERCAPTADPLRSCPLQGVRVSGFKLLGAVNQRDAAAAARLFSVQDNRIADGLGCRPRLCERSGAGRVS